MSHYRNGQFGLEAVSGKQKYFETGRKLEIYPYLFNHHYGFQQNLRYSLLFPVTIHVTAKIADRQKCPHPDPAERHNRNSVASNGGLWYRCLYSYATFGFATAGKIASPWQRGWDLSGVAEGHGLRLRAFRELVLSPTWWVGGFRWAVIKCV